MLFEIRSEMFMAKQLALRMAMLLAIVMREI